MASLKAIRVALAANLDPIGDPWNVSPYMKANVPVPSIQVTGPDLVDFDVAGSRGQDVWIILVMAFAGLANDQAAQERLDELLAGSGSRSVKEAIESDCQLGGVAQDLIVKKISGYQLIRPELIGMSASQGYYLGCTWDVEVHAEGAP